mgnify:CR=1 FL=1
MSTVSTSPLSSCPNASDPLLIAGRQFNSRLFTGTGKYPNLATMQQSLERSGCEIVTVAVRRVQTVAVGHEGLMEAIDWSRIWMLPNTAGCATADEAVRVARLGRELAKLAGQAIGLNEAGTVHEHGRAAIKRAEYRLELTHAGGTVTPETSSDIQPKEPSIKSV